MPRPAVKVRPTPEGKAFLFLTWALAMAAVFLRENAILLLASLVLGCTLASYPLVRRGLSRLRVERSAPARARVGVPTSVTYRLHNGGRRAALGIAIREARPPGVAPWAFRVVGGEAHSGVTTAQATVTFLRRGLRRLDAMTLSTRYPLGVFEASRAEPAPVEVLVRPREGRATARLRARLAGHAPASSRTRLSPGGSEHLYGLRDWREGDDPRRIHWRTTARRGVSTVSEWRGETGRDVWVVLGRGEGVGPAADARFERAVSTAATVARACALAGVPARLCLGAPGEHRTGGLRLERDADLGRALDALALARPQGARRPRGVLRRVSRRGGGRTLVWVGTSSEPAARDVLARAGRVGWSTLHLRVDDPGLSRWVRGLP